MIFTEEKTLTVREFLDLDTFEDGYLYELIKGEIVKRATPDTEHQSASTNLMRHFLQHVPEKITGKIFHAPYDVYLDEENLVQPDLIFVSQKNAHIIQKGCIVGVPDLVVEILSPGTYRTDRGAKHRLYQRLGVQEYWIADPRSKTIEVYALTAGVYDLVALGEEDDSVESQVLTGLIITINAVFG
ncbi:MAG: Uma2 family endonuclease [Saprospiraceae bacterium]